MHIPTINRAIGFGALMMSAAMACAATYDIKRNDVIPVRFDTVLSTTANQPGDRFTATAERGDIFPVGTRFDGHIVRIQHKTRRHGASMDLAFDDVLLADGVRQPIDGVPIPLSDKYVNRDRDGHYVAKASVRPSTAVGLGALGGLIIGSILHKPFEGAFVGTLAGILVANTAGRDDETLTIQKDAEAGVLFNRDVRIDTEASASVRNDPPVRGEGGLSARVADRTLSYSEDLAPYRIEGTVMVPIESTARQLGMSYEEADGSIFVENDNHSLRLEESGQGYRFDGRGNQLPTAIARHNGVWYAPAIAFSGFVGR